MDTIWLTAKYQSAILASLLGMMTVSSFLSAHSICSKFNRNNKFSRYPISQMSTNDWKFFRYCGIWKSFGNFSDQSQILLTLMRLSKYICPQISLTGDFCWETIDFILWVCKADLHFELGNHAN
jgi:hypothetical protein